MRWQLNRAGLFNFWYYDEEEFHFADGKLLLRGSNGSGKSVTMQSLIPVLLDGRKSPDRLDPFGSRARRMEDYLLGEKDVSDLDERTGYLYLEYHRPGTQEYLTTGIGLKAKRQGTLDFWGFILWDNRRIGRDFQLFKTERALNGTLEKIPLTRRELEHRLADGGEVVKTQKDYMERVNRYLFGFKAVEDYDDLIKLLIQLRSPKLSKDFRPTVVYEILNAALPSLSDDELRPLSDTIETMDQIKSQLDQLQKEEQALKRLVRYYDQYNHKVRGEKAEGFLQAHQRLLAAAQTLKRLHLEREETESALSKRKEDEMSLKREQLVLGQEREALEEHDVFKAEKERSDLQQKQRINQENLVAKQKQLAGNVSQEGKLKEQIGGLELKEQRTLDRIHEELEELEGLAEESDFLNHEVAAHEFEKNLEQLFSFALWKKEARDYQSLLERVSKALRQEAAGREKYQEAELMLGESKKAWDEAQHQEKKWADVLHEEQSKWVENLFAWQPLNQELWLEDIELQTLAQRARSFPESVSTNSLREPLQNAANRARDKIRTEILQARHQQDQLQRDVKAKIQEIESWRQRKDPEPSRHDLTNQARQSLQGAGIPFVPFYAAVEFHDQVPQETRERLESALKEMGILDALILPELFAPQTAEQKQVLQSTPVHDRVLKPDPQILAHTLADYLYPTPAAGSQVMAEDIDNLLRTILVEEGRAEGNGSTTLTTAGSYRIGALQGHAPQEESALYIGKEARLQLRLRRIKQLEAEREVLDQQVQELEGRLQTLKQRSEILEAEYRGFPGETAIQEAWDIIYTVRKEAALLEKDVQRKNETLLKTLEAWRNLKAQVKELSKTLTLPLDELAYEKALEAVGSYKDELNTLESRHQQLHSLRRERSAVLSHHQDVAEAVDELRGDINELEDQSLTLRDLLRRVEQRLQDLGADEIRRRIQIVIRRLSDLPGEIETCIKQITMLTKNLEDFTQKILEQERDCSLAENLHQGWAKVFQAEETLQTSFYHDLEGELKPDSHAKVPALSSAPLHESHLGDLRQRAEEFLRSQDTRNSNSPDRETLRERINDAFTKEMGNLVEYRLTQNTLFEALDELSRQREEGPELWLKLWEELRQKARRLQLMLEYDGKRVNPYYLQAQLGKNMTLQRQLLNEKDRELYEEIIMNSVGRIIRGRIQRAEHWVEEMNRLMDERDTSSGLRFRIRWKPRTAEQEDEIDTQDLVELLKSDPRLLKETDMSRITNHFRAKIERAKQQLEIKGFGESFHQIIKEMLDYRHWFEFRLFYQKEGENWRELTDRAFYQFSGGEKAMAMYIPLFSAAYSRYSDARPDAPRIISLDEAFAGVDENNIRDMFDLLEKLGFNYIMNSQALWGDYDTVSKLAIAELVRPKNASFVTVIRYRWDGKVRCLDV
ncbi:TIGR02680 family protein [Desulfosporosinus youngiae]|uniref:TIGR02680 family protein n=1 Tax=Desulfosporosinus youngiae DSM 17734 TaxID=768710 RepID=H5XV19_9FIRM|nr:TIGR02680 family protein [Desulfosporosinus youngiae]EHQ89471.1 TIGR02680 family protein [Desulfosporosinus youngiae DSM 17734]